MEKELKGIATELEAKGLRCIIDKSKSKIVVEINKQDKSYEVAICISELLVVSVSIPEYVNSVPVKSVPEIMKFIGLVNKSALRICLEYDEGTIRLKLQNVLAICEMKELTHMISALAYTAASIEPFIRKVSEESCSAFSSYNQWIKQVKQEDEAIPHRRIG